MNFFNALKHLSTMLPKSEVSAAPTDTCIADSRVVDALFFCEAKGLSEVILAVPFPLPDAEQKALAQSSRCRGLILRNPSPELTRDSDNSWLGCFNADGSWNVPICAATLVFVGSQALLTRKMLIEVVRRRLMLYCRIDGVYERLPLHRAFLDRAVTTGLNYVSELPPKHPLSRLRAAGRSNPALLKFWMRVIRGRDGDTHTHRARMRPSEAFYRTLLSRAAEHAKACGFCPISGRVILVNSGLAAGGAERQIVNTLQGLHGSGKCESVTFLAECLNPTSELDFFLHELTDSGIEIAQVRRVSVERDGLASLPADLASMLCDLDGLCVQEILGMVSEFRNRRPEVVHAWQDSTSIKVGIAATIAGVPRIVLASRNVAPTNFAYHQAYMKPAYAALADCASIVFLNNSHAGAVDYAHWLGVAEDTFSIIRNGLDFSGLARASCREVSEYKSVLGIPADVIVIGSIFRFWPEKRPLLWLEAAALVAHQRPDAHFLLIGDGPLRSKMELFLERSQLAPRFHLPGTSKQVSLPLSAMDAFLLTSAFEGTPNVVLEAQWLGVPVVATNSGGTAESFADRVTGLLAREDSPQEIASRLLALLEDEELMRTAKESGPAFVAERFGLQRMVSETLAVYGIDISSTFEEAAMPGA